MRKCMGPRVAGPKRTLAASVLPLVSHSEQTPAALLSPLPGQTWRRAQNGKYVLLLYLLASKHTQACTQSTFAQAFKKQQRQAAREAVIPINAGRLYN